MIGIAILMRFALLIVGVLVMFQQGKGLVDVFRKSYYMVPHFIQDLMKKKEDEQLLK